jgi:YesN/AraC family two-component response regulator
MSTIMKTIIVDDEPLARERLISTYPFHEHGYEIVGTVGDGEKALRICSEQHVDIVITDIVMPRMDGLELTQQLRDRFPHVKVILLSNYQEFEFARQAMQFGAIGYMLKVTSDYQELLALLERAKSEIMLQHRKQSEEIRERHHFQQHLGVLRQHFLQELLNGVSHSQEALQAKCEYLRLQLPDYALTVAIIRIDRFDSLVSLFPPKDIALLKYALSQMVEELANEYTSASVLPMNEQDIVLLCHWKEEASDSASINHTTALLQEKIHNSISEYLPFSVTITAGCGYQLVTRDGFTGIINHAVREAESILSSHAKPVAIATEPIAREDMQRVLDYISEHYSEPLSLTSVCEQIGMSPSYFSHLFKKVVGFNFSEYLTIYRIQQAKLLLTETSMQIQDIARNVGITDYKYFSKLFRKYAKVAPSEFRNLTEYNQ